MWNNCCLFVWLLALLSCSTGGQESDGPIFFQNEPAIWITDGRPLPEHDSLLYLDRPAPLFRKEFAVDGPIEKATLYITAAGYYHASINGAPVGENVLDPAWTDYSKRIYYTAHDVTPLMAADTNCLAVSIGNGFYNPLPLRKWGRRNLRSDTHVGKPTFLAKLVLRYSNDTSEEIVSDLSWKYAYGPLIRNSVYLGVLYDARREIPGWDQPGFEDDHWQTVDAGTAPGGMLQETFFPPTQVTEEISPIDIYAATPDVWMVDMGVNFTGTYRIKLDGNPDDTITLRFGERIYEDGSLNPMTSVIGQVKKKGVGGPGAPDIAWQTDSYILGGQVGSWFSPQFTYYTYRYMEIKGLANKPQISDIQGLFMHSNIVNQNSFSSSSDLLNAIQDATERTFRANLVGVQSDCPAREKFGYGGDLNATSESFIYNFDMQSFYRKTIYDWLDAMNDTGFVDTAPFVGIQYCGLSWESAFLTTQYYLYLYYQDTAIIHELYERDKQWMEKVARIHPEGRVDQGLSDHESLEPVPVALTGTCHYLQCAQIMSAFASVMGQIDDAAQYDRLAEQLRAQVRAEFWDKPVEGDINRQTLFATLLYHDIVPAAEIAAAADSLVHAVQNGPNGHFTTGIFGTKYVLESLSKYASTEQVFDIVHSTAYPGWGHMIDRGATTIWETWKESDNTYSNCHPMFGTVTEWYYRWLCGIRPDREHPGFKSFHLAPTPPEGLARASATYHSPFGAISSSWSMQPGNSYKYNLTVPEGTTAKVTLPVDHHQSVEVTEHPVPLDKTSVEGLQSGRFTLNGGHYEITVR